MRQLDVCLLKVPRSRDRKIYVVLLQRDWLESLATRVVAPLELIGKVKSVSKLNPVVTLEGVNYALMVERMASVQAKLLSPSGYSLASQRDEIIRAIDFVFTG